MTKSKFWVSLCIVSCPQSHPLLVEAGIVGPTAVGTSVLIVGNKNFKVFSAQLDIDLGHLENSISHLEAQAYSLSEVFLKKPQSSAPLS